MKQKLPNLIIAGVNKAGTSSLFTYLSKHPNVCGSSIKETCYFLPTRYNQKIEDINTYFKYFEGCKNEKYIMEATPGYFYGGEKTARYMDDTLTNLKIIILLRNPIDIAYSFYKHLKGKALINNSLTFEDCIYNISKEFKNDLQSHDYFNRMVYEGVYIKFLKDWYNTFSKDSIKILFFDDLEKHPEKVLLEVCEWLDIEKEFYNNYEFQVENISVEYKRKFFHQLALYFYGKTEKFFRKNTKLKNFLRDNYYKVNATQPKVIDETTYKSLDKYYKQYNKDLHDFLIEMGYSEFPEWMRG